MKKSVFGTVLVLLFSMVNALATNYYVSTSGSDSNSGTSTSSPFKTFQKAVDAVSAGDYIYLRGGTHGVSASVIITKNGTSSANIRVFAYSGETPVLQFDNAESPSNRGIVMEGDFWHWKGIIIEKAGDNGMLLSGSNNTIESCVFRKNCDTGLQLSRYYGTATTIGSWPSNNLILNCESYDNKDSGNENADGFAAKLTCGEGNVFRGCIAHHNIDDGWDLYTKSETGPIGVVVFEDCIAHSNGSLTDGVTSGGGDKNGYKLGSSSNTVNHILRRCIAYNNGKHGFTDNGNVGSIKFYNLTSYNNDGYNFHTRDNATHVFRNCISIGANNDRIVGDVPSSNNYFEGTGTGDYTVKTSDFRSMTPGANADPTANGFLAPAPSGGLIDRGVAVSGVAYSGSSPDMGAVEYNGTYAYTLATNVTGSGTVTGGGSYNSGMTVTLTATPASGWEFSKWTGDVTGTSATTSITITGHASVTAIFVEKGNGNPNPTEDVVHNFTESGASSSFFDITGNLSSSKGTVAYNGLTLTQCLKIESSTNISFTTADQATLTLVFNETFADAIKVDGASYSASSGIATIDLTAGAHTITKDNSANLYYMSLAYAGGGEAGSIALSATPEVAKVYLGWTASNIATSFQIYRDTDSDPAGRALVTTTTATSYTDTGLADATTYYYWIKATDAQGSIINSNMASATTAAITTGSISLSGSATENNATLNWSASNIASSFQVYRDTDSDPSGRVRVGSTTGTSYTDSGLAGGISYFYWIKATDVSGNTINSNIAEVSIISPSITITIQENENGFCAVDGSVDSNNAGFTGSGFANTTNAAGTTIEYSINSIGASAQLEIKYANGSSTDRAIAILVNGSTAIASLSMPSTGSWTTWSTVNAAVPLGSGTNSLVFEALTGESMGNVDYIILSGAGVSAAACSAKSGVVETTATEIVAYPNPVIDVLNISADATLVQVYNMSGNLVASAQNTSTINMSGLPTGTYALRIITEATVATKTIVKQ